jgi:hypothetical protein
MVATVTKLSQSLHCSAVARAVELILAGAQLLCTMTVNNTTSDHTSAKMEQYMSRYIATLDSESQSKAVLSA